jgi:nicotinamide-nucleotide amidase
MIVEVLSVGTELLIGQIINTNAAWIGSRLTDEGFDVNHHVTVGDNLARLSEAIATAMRRADAVIMTGGIGPTQDDLTREAICLATGRSMDRDDAYANLIRERIMARRGSIVPSVLRMAEYPLGATKLPNSQGVALGIALEHDGRQIFAVPGVPREMKAMIDGGVMPRLRAFAGKAAVIRSRVLHTWGHGESQIADLLHDLYTSTNPSIAFLISDMEVKVRMTAKADTPEEADALISPMENEIRRRLADVVFATDDETVTDVIRRTLVDRDWTLAVAENATDGLVAHRLGGLDRFAGGMLLRDGSDADQLAARAIEQFRSDVGVGVSPPRPVDDSGDMATEVTFAISTPTANTIESMRFFGTGERARSYAVIAAVHHLRIALR